MTRILFALVASLVAGSAVAQPAPQYTAPDAELWSLMTKALRDVPASADAHDAVARILANVQQEARTRELRAKLPPPKDDPK